MSTKQITTAEQTKPSALAVMANRVSVDPAKLLATLRETVFKGSNESELLALVVVANEYGLNPFLKEIYAFPAKGGGIAPIVSIDGWIKIVNRQQNLDGIELVVSEDGEECTCRIFLKDRSHPVEVTEYLAECRRNTEPWKQMPKRMLRHKALIQAARVAFGFSGIFDEDEARDITNVKVGRDPIPMPKAKSAQVEKEPDVVDAEVSQAESAQRTILIQLESDGISEADFVKALRKAGYKCDTVIGLSDEDAEKVLFDYKEIAAGIKEGK